MTSQRPITCATCGADAKPRAFWTPVACRGAGAGRIDGSATQIERRTCGHCGDDFCVCVHRPQRFCSLACRGAGLPPWNRGGGLVLTGGRWYVSCRDGASLAYSRCVMAAEIGRLLTPDEIVHHINGDPADDRPENLQITTRSEHARIHIDNLARVWAQRERENAA